VSFQRGTDRCRANGVIGRYAATMSSAPRSLVLEEATGIKISKGGSINNAFRATN